MSRLSEDASRVSSLPHTPKSSTKSTPIRSAFEGFVAMSCRSRFGSVSFGLRSPADRRNAGPTEGGNRQPGSHVRFTPRHHRRLPPRRPPSSRISTASSRQKTAPCPWTPAARSAGTLATSDQDASTMPTGSLTAWCPKRPKDNFAFIAVLKVLCRDPRTL